MLPKNDPKIEIIFSLLAKERYEITSPIDHRYNCIAWAAQVNHQFWWPDNQMQFFWPEEIPRVCTIEAFVKAYNLIGYEICENPDFEDGIEKIAIYVDQDGTPTHASRQLSKGVWTSKLGSLYDISHAYEGVNCQLYGSPSLLMQRKRAIVI